MPAKDIQGRKIPTNLVMLERWSNLVKQPSEPLPPHMVLDWEQNGAACSTASEPAKITVEEALTPDIVQYLSEKHLRAHCRLQTLWHENGKWGVTLELLNVLVHSVEDVACPF